MSADRLPPYSQESEQGVLGCMLLDPRECMPLAVERISSSDVFYDMRNGAIYDAALALFEAEGHLEPITFQQYLKDRNQLEALGGMPYIVSLMNCVPSAANLDYYLEIVLEKYTLRKLIQTCTSAVAKIYEHQGNVVGLLGEVEREILKIGDTASNTHADIAVKEAMKLVIDEMQDALANKGKVRGLQTGFPDLDWKTYGLKPGQLFIIAARPSVGKTSFAMNIVEHVAVDCKIPVGVFSLEMGTTELLHRMACARARVDSERAQGGDFQEGDFPRLSTAMGQISNAPLYICERGGLTISQLAARARRWVQRHGIKLLVVDYLQLMQSQSKENRTNQITEISNGLKALLKDLGIPGIVLSQLSREVEKQDRPPRLSDLRESGAIEQDADGVGLLHPKLNEKGEIPEQQEVDLLICKLRGGKVGKIPMIFNRPFTRFESSTRARPSTSDVPTPKHWND